MDGDIKIKQMNKVKTILSVIPGRHRLGYAIFHRNRLIFYGVTSLSGFKTRDETNTAVERFLMKITNRFQIDRIVIRKLTKSQAVSILLLEIAEHLKNLCRKQKIKVLRYDGNFVNRYFCKNDERPTNETTALFLISKYPELKRYQNLNQVWQQRYYSYIFKAIALGLVCLEELERKKSGEDL